MDTIQKVVRQRRSKTPLMPIKVGISNLASTIKKQIVQKVFDRKMLLKIPQEILDRNFDKHFCWVNMPRLERSGFYHPDGYKLFEMKDMPGETGPDAKLVSHFQKSPDGYMHRNEMVLAWIPKEEYEQRIFEDEVMRGQVDLESVIAQNPTLIDGFDPHAKCEKKVKIFETTKKKQEVTNG